MEESAVQLAMADIANKFGPMVSSVCRRMIRDEELAKDAAQEVWLQVVKSLPSFEGRSKLSTWIYAVTQRVVANFAQNERVYSLKFLRSYFRGEEINTEIIDEAEKKIWIKEMCDKCLNGILHCLDNESRLAFIFRDIARLPYQEIARIMDRDEPGTRKLISRGRRKLKSFLQDECILYNPDGECRCRMRNMVKSVDLEQEFKKMRSIVWQVNVFQEAEKVLPVKNFWQKYF